MTRPPMRAGAAVWIGARFPLEPPLPPLPPLWFADPPPLPPVDPPEPPEDELEAPPEPPPLLVVVAVDAPPPMIDAPLAATKTPRPEGRAVYVVPPISNE